MLRLVKAGDAKRIDFGDTATFEGRVEMELGMIGLGRMGGNMAQRLLLGGHRVVAYDPDEEAVAASVKQGAVGASSLVDLVTMLSSPRAVWTMVPAGQPTEDTIDALAGMLSSGDTIIDGGNANYKDSMRRAAKLKERGLDFLDSGTSGGVWGLTEGYSLMIGGDTEAYERLLQDALEGDASLFIRSDHIEEAWRLVEPVLQHAEDPASGRPESYRQGSWGPQAAADLLDWDGRSWIQVCGGHGEPG